MVNRQNHRRFPDWRAFGSAKFWIVFAYDLTDRGVLLSLGLLLFETGPELPSRRRTRK